jgi:ankyrin repeat protein
MILTVAIAQNVTAMYPDQIRKQAFEAVAIDDVTRLKSLANPDPTCCNPLLYEACAYDSPKCAEFLISLGANVNYYDGMNNTTPLWNALLHEKFEIAETLFARGASVNQLINRRVFLSGNYPETALSFFAARIEKAQKRVEWLLAHGADPNIPQQGTEITPLWQVCQQTDDHTFILTAEKKVALAKALLDAGAKIDIKAGYYDTTPLEEAEKDENKMLASFLKEYKPSKPR